MLDLRVGTKVIELRNINEMGVTGSLGGSSQVGPLSHPRQGGHGYQNGQQSQSSNQNSLTHTYLWHWLVEHVVPRSKIGSLLNSYLICINRKVLGQMNKSLT